MTLGKVLACISVVRMLRDARLTALMMMVITLLLLVLASAVSSNAAGKIRQARITTETNTRVTPTVALLMRPAEGVDDGVTPAAVGGTGVGVSKEDDVGVFAI